MISVGHGPFGLRNYYLSQFFYYLFLLFMFALSFLFFVFSFFFYSPGVGPLPLVRSREMCALSVEVDPFRLRDY